MDNNDMPITSSPLDAMPADNTTTVESTPMPVGPAADSGQPSPIQKKSDNTVLKVLAVIGILLLICCGIAGAFFLYSANEVKKTMDGAEFDVLKNLPNDLNELPDKMNQMPSQMTLTEIALGQTASSEIFELTVKSAEVKDDKVLLNIAVKNNSTEAQPFSTLLMLRLQNTMPAEATEKGNTYYQDFFGEYEAKFDVDIPADETIEGPMEFALNGDVVEVGDLYLEFTPDFIAMEGFKMLLK